MASKSLRYPPTFWDNHIKKLKSSGLTQREYCAENGISLKALSNQVYLRKKAEKLKASPGATKSAFVKAVVRDDSEPKKIPEEPRRFSARLITKNKTVIEFDSDVSGEWIGNILRAMEGI